MRNYSVVYTCIVTGDSDNFPCVTRPANMAQKYSKVINLYFSGNYVVKFRVTDGCCMLLAMPHTVYSEFLLFFQLSYPLYHSVPDRLLY